MTTAITAFPALTTGVTYVNSEGVTKAALVIVTPDTLKEGTSLELDAAKGQIVVKVLNVAAHDYSRVVSAKGAVEAKVAQALAVKVQAEDGSHEADEADAVLAAHLDAQGVLKSYWAPLAV